MTSAMTRGVGRIAPWLPPCLVWLAAGAASAAPPQVEIRAQTKPAIDKVRLTGDDVAEIRGELLDNLTGDGIGGQHIVIRIDDQTERATTGPDGRFRTTIAVTAGQQTVELEFRGSGLLSPAK